MSADAEMMPAPYPDWEGRYDHLDKLLLRGGPMAVEGYTPCVQLKEFLLNNVKVLIIGAGGLGCELLKDLAFMGFRNITVIDMDTIDLSNLNRQFLFRHADVGKSKAEVAAAFIRKRIPGIEVVGINKRIEQMDNSFYQQFQLVVSGLDSVNARRWISAKLVSLVQYDDDRNPVPGTIIPFIDGGSEGFKGQVRVMVPGMTACFECMIGAFPPQTTFQLCTLASTPRLPEHCVAWAQMEWKKTHPDEVADNDNLDHVRVILDMAIERANAFNLPTTTLNMRFTQGVMKNVIPAVASTNALVAAACANEAFKMVTNAAGNLDNWMMYVGDNALYTYTFQYERKKNCPVCGAARVTLNFDSSRTLQELREEFMAHPDMQLKAPDVRYEKKTLYMGGVMDQHTKHNLSEPVSKLFTSGQVLTVMDSSVMPDGHFEVTVNFMEIEGRMC